MIARQRLFFFLRAVGAVGSGIMLAVSFPPMSDASTAWAALVPLLMVTRFCTPRAGFLWGLLSGSVFWLVSLSWLLRLAATGGPLPLVVLGWILLSGYCAVFVACFAMLTAALFSAADRRRVKDGGGAGPEPRSMALERVAMVLLIPMLWVGFEYLRGILFTGFPWNALGVSQFQNVPVIQIAEWGGVYAVSAVVAAMNAALAMMLLRFVDSYRLGRQSRLQFDLVTGLLICALCWMHGMRRVREIGADRTGRVQVRIGAVQPNVPQFKKWPDSFRDYVYEAVETRTRMVAVGEPDLVVWPETALPGQLSADAAYATPDALEFMAKMTALGHPILVGAIEMAPGPNVGGAGAAGKPRSQDLATMLMRGELAIYNSSFLFDGGAVVAQYRKQHLVPFGEYLPFDKKLRFLQRIAPVGYSCTRGDGNTVFRLPMPGGREAAFSTLICFEDIVAGLARRAVRDGARLLINQTNDAWFDGSAGAVQHMAHCVFRCVENRVPAVRCANTGVTCYIDRVGQIDKVTRDMLVAGETHLANYRMGSIFVEGAGMRQTLYTRYGDIFFAMPCALLSLVGIGMMTVRERRKKKLATS